MENKKSEIKKEDIWRKALYSADIELIKQTLDEIEEKGNAEILTDIINIYKGYKNSSLESYIFNFLINIKNQSAVPVIMKHISDSHFASIKSDLLSICWQAQLDFSEYAEFLTDLFIKAPIKIAFEAFTILEYSDNIDVRILEKCVTKLQKSVSKISEDKKELLVDLVNMLKNKAANETDEEI